MYLKGLEIKGFKSFSEKTNIDFIQGITSIVGPNGSGKSNILDAILWVLGEQSYKSIRASTSSDVIFSGGKNKKYSSSAEVSLIIDNSDRYLDIQSDEVIVTRRIYRSGDGEYYINNKKCRLKDIHNLFMDTGIGKQAYSIIGQGRVERIISSNPKEIREIIEEAAGTKRAKVEKENANKRLSNVQIELDKIVYVEKELENRVKRLKEESEKASLYKSILRQIDVKNYMLYEYNLQKYKLDEEKLNIEKSKVEEDIKSIEKKLDEENIKVKEIINKRSELIQEVNELKITIKDIELEIEKDKEELSVVEKNMSNFEVKLEEKVKQKYKLLSSKAEKEEKISFYKKEILDLDRDVNKYLKSKNELTEKVNALTSKLNELEKSIEEKDKLLKEIEIKNYRLRTENEELERKIGLSKNNIKSLNEEKKETILSRDALKLEYENLKLEAKEKEEKYKEIESKNKNINEEITKLNIELKDISNTKIKKNYILEQKKSTLMSIQKTLEENVFASKSTKYILNKYKNDENIIDSVSNLLIIPKEYLVAISNLASFNLNDIVIKSSNNVKEYIDDLKREKVGTVSFLPLDSIKIPNLNNILPKGEGIIDFARNLVKTKNKNLEKLINHVFSNALVVENINVANDVMKKGYLDRIITLEGDIISSRGRIVGGYRKNNVDLTLSKKDELTNLELEISNIETEILKLDRQYDNLNSKILEYNNYLSEDSVNINSFNFEYNKLKNYIEDKENQISSLNRKISTYDYEINDTESLIIKHTNQIDTNGEIIKNNLSNLEVVFDEKEDLELEIASLESVDKYNKKLTEVSVHYAVLSEKLTSTKNTNDDILKEYNIIVNDLEEIYNFENDKDKLFETFKEDIRKLKENIEKNNLEKNQNLDKFDNLEKLIKDMEKNETDSMTYINNLEKDIIKTSNISEKIAENIARIKIELENIINSLDNYKDKKDELVLDQDYYKIEDDNGIQVIKREIVSLENKKTNIGSVSLASIDEYNVENERYLTLKQNKEDLEKSSSQIKKLISDIEDEMIQKFTLALKEIKNNFKFMCYEIFYGSKGDIILTNPEDILNSGLELQIKYKNKPAQSLMLLSGGEKSMLAVSFILAIFMFKPSPFTFFDEIEAALDETNTKKIIELLRRFIDKSQFILITHNKETMKGSDRLYGVTMNKEVGESKIVSVDI